MVIFVAWDERSRLLEVGLVVVADSVRKVVQVFFLGVVDVRPPMATGQYMPIVLLSGQTHSQPLVVILCFTRLSTAIYSCL